MEKNKKIKSGLVVSNKMDKSIVVEVERKVKHPFYEKTIKRSKKYIAHDAENICNIGDSVKIIECKPMSRRKRWLLLEVSQ